MSKDILQALGIDKEDLQWYHLAACNGMIQSIHQNNKTDKPTSDFDPFFDAYESDQIVAQATDQMCLSCPVIKQCYREGVTQKGVGVWGGVYLNLGKPDKKFNAHKTPEVWKAVRKIHGKLSIG